MAAIRVDICQMTFGYDGISQPVSSPRPSGPALSALSLCHGAADVSRCHDRISGKMLCELFLSQFSNK